MESAFVSTAVTNYLRSDGGRMAYTPEAYGATLAEGTIADYLHSTKKIQIPQENNRHWLFHPDFTLDLLSNEVVDGGPNLLSPLTAGVI